MGMRFFGVLAALALAFAACAQTRGSFLRPATITGLSTQQVGATGFKLVVGPNPSFQLNGNIYDVITVFGYYRLDNNDDFFAAGRDQRGWRFYSNTQGRGGVFGFKTNVCYGLRPCEEITLCFDCVSGCPDCVGYGVYARSRATGQSAEYYIEDCVVPEPATMLGLLGAAALIRRRKS